jgi:hypothetical protein
VDGPNAAVGAAWEVANSWEMEEQATSPLSRNALPGEVRIEPPLLDDSAGPVSSDSRDHEPGSDPDDEFGGPFTGLRGKPLTIGDDVPATKYGGLTLLGRQRSSGARWRRVPRAARIAIPVVLLAAVLGALAQGRYSTYSREVQTARSLASHQQYGPALGRYQQAIADWPLHSAAAKEQAQVAATATVVAAQATAVAVQQQAITTAAADRADVYAAWRRMHQQAQATPQAIAGGQ